METKCLFLVFWAGVSKVRHTLNQHHRICLIATFGIKNALFRSFWDRILRSYCRIWNHPCRICLFPKFCKKKQRWINLGQKLLYLGIFDQKCLIWVILGHNFQKIIVIFLSYQRPQICLFAKLSKKTKLDKFGTKIALFALKSAPSNLFNCKILWRNENV